MLCVLVSRWGKGLTFLIYYLFSSHSWLAWWAVFATVLQIPNWSLRGVQSCHPLWFICAKANSFHGKAQVYALRREVMFDLHINIRPTICLRHPSPSPQSEARAVEGDEGPNIKAIENKIWQPGQRKTTECAISSSQEPFLQKSSLSPSSVSSISSYSLPTPPSAPVTHLSGKFMLSVAPSQFHIDHTNWTPGGSHHSNTRVTAQPARGVKEGGASFDWQRRRLEAVSGRSGSTGRMSPRGRVRRHETKVQPLSVFVGFLIHPKHGIFSEKKKKIKIRWAAMTVYLGDWRWRSQDGETTKKLWERKASGVQGGEGVHVCVWVKISICLQAAAEHEVSHRMVYGDLRLLLSLLLLSCVQWCGGCM